MLVRPLFWVRTLDFCTFYYRGVRREGDESGGTERLRRSGYKWQAGPLQLFQEQPPPHVHSIYAHTITHSSGEGIT